MNTKRFIYTLVAVFVLLEIMNFIVHGLILADTYVSEELKAIFRPQDEMSGMMWMVWLADLVWAFFFTFIFVKGYENKGIWEGVRYGLYMGIFVSLVGAFQSYAMSPLTFSLVIQWFIYGFIEALILGMSAAYIYKPKGYEVKAAAGAPA